MSTSENRLGVCSQRRKTATILVWFTICSSKISKINCNLLISHQQLYRGIKQASLPGLITITEDI